MKMVRSLLLGSAAGFVAVAGAQAADMPVKAKPVEYVKICTLYGAGFYYLPGTDICVKHGAYVRSQWYFGAGAAPTNGPFLGASGQSITDFQSTPNTTVHRTRAVYTLDARTQTEYGTLRAYTLIGYTHETPANGANVVGQARHTVRDPRLPAVRRVHPRQGVVVLRHLVGSGEHVLRRVVERHR